GGLAVEAEGRARRAGEVRALALVGAVASAVAAERHLARAVAAHPHRADAEGAARALGVADARRLLAGRDAPAVVHVAAAARRADAPVATDHGPGLDAPGHRVRR